MFGTRGSIPAIFLMGLATNLAQAGFIPGEVQVSGGPGLLNIESSGMPPRLDWGSSLHGRCEVLWDGWGWLRPYLALGLERNDREEWSTTDGMGNNVVVSGDVIRADRVTAGLRVQVALAGRHDRVWVETGMGHGHYDGEMERSGWALEMGLGYDRLLGRHLLVGVGFESATTLTFDLFTDHDLHQEALRLTAGWRF